MFGRGGGWLRAKGFGSVEKKAVVLIPKKVLSHDEHKTLEAAVVGLVLAVEHRHFLDLKIIYCEPQFSCVYVYICKILLKYGVVLQSLCTAELSNERKHCTYFIT